MSIAELQQNPLVQRVIDIFDADGNGEVDFKEFIQGVSQFSVKGDKLSKLRFAFRIYDMDNDGFISNGELFQVNASLYIYCTSNILFSHLKYKKKIKTKKNHKHFALFLFAGAENDGR